MPSFYIVVVHRDLHSVLKEYRLYDYCASKVLKFKKNLRIMQSSRFIKSTAFRLTYALAIHCLLFCSCFVYDDVKYEQRFEFIPLTFM